MEIVTLEMCKANPNPAWLRSYFCDFLERYEYVNVEELKCAEDAQEFPYVVLAHIIGILSTTSGGIDLIAEDHTGTTIFGLRRDAAMDFYEQHLRTYNTHEEVANQPTLYEERN